MEEQLEKVENSLQFRNLSNKSGGTRSESAEAFWTSFDYICSAWSGIGHSDVCEEEGKGKALGLLTKVKGIDFIVSIMFMKNIMYKTTMMCNALKAE